MVDASFHTVQTFPIMDLHDRKTQNNSNGEISNPERKITADDKKNQLLYEDDDMPRGLREPFIKTGYRRAYSTTWQCLQSLVYINNESFNVWSHILTTCYFVVRYGMVLAESKSWLDPFYLPMLTSSIGTFTMYSTSAIAHLFNSISERGYKTCFFFDYAGISVYTFTCSQALFFYCRPMNTNWMIFESPGLYLCLAALFSFLTTYGCCLTNASVKRFSTLYRALPVLAAWFNSTLPMITGVIFCTCHAVTNSCMAFAACNTLAFSHYLRHGFSLFLAAFMYSSRLPERLFPGRFDLIGNSHHFLHICCALGTEFAFKIVEFDMNRRKSENFIEETTAFVTLGNTLGAVVLVMIINAGIAFWFSKSLIGKESNHKK